MASPWSLAGSQRNDRWRILIPPALVSGETRVEPVTPEHTKSATATEVVCCYRGGRVRGRPPLHMGAT
ncbi:hypothetical protein [Haloquadratum walsbyi]|uniref:hypothetical protein n=1 Tax=Haloquadratum walsbyi TaxID=293091 RepID=UPI0011EA6884|nr:hypothetical protein [Haloquadratum walsbyi]